MWGTMSRFEEIRVFLFKVIIVQDLSIYQGSAGAFRDLGFRAWGLVQRAAGESSPCRTLEPS